MSDINMLKNLFVNLCYDNEVETYYIDRPNIHEIGVGRGIVVEEICNNISNKAYNTSEDYTVMIFKTRKIEAARELTKEREDVT